jgi:acetolactate synthase-1/2/3 large subunit
MSEAWDELHELAELLQIPVTTTLNGKSAFPENHPLYVGCGGRGHTGAAKHFYNKADVVFSIGSSCTTDMFIFTIPPGKKLIQLAIDERDINKDYAVELAVIGDAKIVLGQLIEEIKKQTGGKGRPKNNALVEEIKAVNNEWMKKWLPKLTSNEMPIHPYRVYWDLMKTLDRRKTIVVPDAGTPRDALSAFWESLIPGGYINYGKDHMLGAGMGLAMGAKLARPGKTVVHIGGDAAFGQVGMDWETAVREKIAMINVVLNDGRMSATHKSSPVAVEKYHINCLSGHYSKIADGLGSYAERVEKPEDIIPAVQRALKIVNSGKPALLEFMTRVVEEEPI